MKEVSGVKWLKVPSKMTVQMANDVRSEVSSEAKVRLASEEVSTLDSGGRRKVPLPPLRSLWSPSS